MCETEDREAETLCVRQKPESQRAETRAVGTSSSPQVSLTGKHVTQSRCWIPLHDIHTHAHKHKHCALACMHTLHYNTCKDINVLGGRLQYMNLFFYVQDLLFYMSLARLATK